MSDNNATQPAQSTANEPAKQAPEKPNTSAAPTQEDLMKVKAGLQSQLDEAKTKLAEAHNLKLQAEARAQALEEKLKGDEVIVKERDSLKSTLESHQAKIKELTDKSLTYRRNLIVKDFGVALDVVKDYDDVQLDMFEKALKTVKTVTGGGNYASGGASGGGATPSSPIDRAMHNLQRAQPGTPNNK